MWAIIGVLYIYLIWGCLDSIQMYLFSHLSTSDFSYICNMLVARPFPYITSSFWYKYLWYFFSPLEIKIMIIMMMKMKIIA